MPLPASELNPGQGLRWMLRGAKLLCALVSTDQVSQAQFFFFCCIAGERSSLVGHRGLNCAENSVFRDTCKTGTKNTTKQQTKPNNNTKQTKDKSRQVLECETRGEKRVKRPKQPNALICRTPGGSMRYP